MRTALHYLPDYQLQVLKYLNQQSELPIEIHSFSSQWDGFDPVLQLNGFQLGQTDPLKIGRISLKFSFIQSLVALKPKFHRILIEQTEISTRQNQTGHWEILGLSTEDIKKTSSKDTDENELLSILAFFNGTTINIKNLNTVISNEKGILRTLRLPNLNVNYKNDQLFVSGQVLESLGEMTLLNFSLKGRDLLSSNTIKGTLFVEARSDEFFGELLQVYDWQKVRIQDVDGSVRAWLNFEGLNVTSIYGDILLRNINWKAGEDSLPPITNLALSYLWQNSEDTNEVELYNFGLEWNGLACDPMDSKISVGQNNDIHIFTNILNIQCATQIALALDFMPPGLQERLTISEPKGFLKNINVHVLPDTKTSDIVDLVSSDTNNSDNPLSVDTKPEHETDSLNSIVHIKGIPLIDEESIQIELEPSKTSFEFEATLDDVDIQAYESTPSGRNLDGYIFADNTSGFVSFLSDDFELGFPNLFLEPWILKNAEGKVSWRTKQQDVFVQSEGLRLWRKDGSLIYGDFILRLNDQLHEDYLSLALGMQDIPVQEAVKFVPFYAVSEGLYSWLSQSLIDGFVTNGIYYGYGSVESEQAENSFTSSILLNTQKGIIQFDPDWPFLEELDSEIIVQNGQLSIEAKEGVIAGTSLKNLTAFMPEKQKGKANYINISAQSSLSSELVNYWLRASPIADNTKDIVDQLTINSKALTDIQLKIPVADDDNGKSDALFYSVNTKITKGSIFHLPSKLEFMDVDGSIQVDSDKGVNADDIKTLVFNRPASLSINTTNSYKNNTINKASTKDVEKVQLDSSPVIDDQNNPLNLRKLSEATDSTDPSQEIKIKSSLTNLTLNGALGVDALFDYFGAQNFEPLTGELLYSANLSISDEVDKYPLLTVKSNLIGVHCACPPPLDKAIDQQSDLSLSLLLKPEQLYLDAKIARNKLPLVDAELLFINEQLSFAEFLIGGASVTDTDIKGINVAAKLKDLDLESWIEFLKQNIKEEDSSDPRNNASVKQVQIHAQSMNAFDHVFQNTNIIIKPQDDFWMASTNGQDIAGIIEFAKTDKPLVLNLDKLNLVPIVMLEEETVSSDDQSTLDPRTLPELAFMVKQLSFDGRDVGSWQFDIKPDQTGSLFQNIKGHIKGSNISGQLNWGINEDLQSTIATVDVSGEDISTLFKAFGLPVLMTSTRYKSDLALVWPDSPMSFNTSRLSGKVLVDMEEGFLKTEDNKTGVLRLFGVLNAESIKRRLKLDFSDLYKSGVGYDTFNANVSIDQGLLTLTEPLVIDGPAGRYVLNGRSDLATKALDIDMLVELPFSQNVPLAALVLGAPQIGGLVWVADKLLGEPLSALTTSRYDITGTWEEPRVDLKQAMNASKKDRSNEKGVRDGRTQTQ